MTVSRRSRRAHGDGGYRKRGDSWELKFPINDPRTGARVMRTCTFKGSETAARAKLRELLKNAEAGVAPVPARQTFGDVLDAWEKGLTVSPKTAERYRELAKLHIRPHLGAIKLQNLRTSALEAFYGDLREGRTADRKTGARKLSARTIGHVHRLIVQALSLAERDGSIQFNPGRQAKRPKVEHSEIEILSELETRGVLKRLRNEIDVTTKEEKRLEMKRDLKSQAKRRDLVAKLPILKRMHRLAALGLATGMRRGEMLALRWKDTDLESGVLRVEQSLEETRASGSTAAIGNGLRFKSPKTRYGRRSISLPGSIVAELRSLRAEQAQERLKLGLGREPDDALVFRTFEGGPLPPNSITGEWRRLVKQLGLPRVSLHAWRHTHASQLIESGMDVLTISRRLGHGSPSITLDVYGHRFSRKDDTAAAVFDKAFAGVMGD